MKPLSIIVAIDEAGGFGKDGKIPWDIPEDLQRFKEITANSICIMGKLTYLDIRKRRCLVTIKTATEPNALIETDKDLLPGRQCYVISKSFLTKYKAGTIVRVPGNAFVKESLTTAIQSISKDNTREIFILGGEKLFIEAWPLVNSIHMSIIKGDPFDCDRFFPIKPLMEDFKITAGSQTDKMYNMTYKRFKK